MITAGKLLSAIQGIEQLGLDVGWATDLNLTNLSHDAVVGEDILSVVAIFWPPAALLEYALAIAVAVAPFVVASGISIKPDPNPIADAQTTQARGGRNG